MKSERVTESGHDRYATEVAAAAGAVDTFVINLCSSTTPMALTHPDAPELKRFQFFISRRLEDGRERFRLHMGHFQSLEEAEDWLSIVRDIYPGAWAGEAPGKRLRGKYSPAPSATLPESKSVPPTAGGKRAVLPSALSTPLPHAPAALGRDVQSQSTAGALPQDTAAALRRAIKAPLPVTAEDGRLSPSAASTSARPAPRAPLSNVREVLAALDETDAQDSQAAADNAAPMQRGLSDTEVMRILEARRTHEPVHGDAEASGGIPMLRPDDSGTRRALHEAVQGNAAVSFAVQLQWSARPMALEKVPPLAIFNAYTLYTVEGNRDGCQWYGLRLGFFSDAIAAKQVAHYVRSDFTAVAVVPVSPEERERAARAEAQTSTMVIAERAHAIESQEIKLLDDATPAEPRAARVRADSAKPGSAAARAAALRSKTQRSAEHATNAKAAHSLEETLEILGAGDLELENGRGELLNHGRVRHLKVELRKDSPFQRLIARLSERVRKT